MNSLERTLITKSGYDHGWEIMVEESQEQVVLASALHRASARVAAAPLGTRWVVTVLPSQIHRELERSYPGYYLSDTYLRADNEAELGQLLAQTARLARALPDAPEIRFGQAVTKELAKQSITSTEVERLVRQRVGQDIYRECLIDYWDGACAVTGITTPELLRASHSKAWADCETDAERLNVYNGFLLTAHLDALFDRHLMTFSATGTAIFSPDLPQSVLLQLGITKPIKLRFLSPEHEPFLAWHRSIFEVKNAARQSSPSPA